MRVTVEPATNGVRLCCGSNDLDMFAAMLPTLNRRIVVHNPNELRNTFRQLSERGTAAAESIYSAT